MYAIVGVICTEAVEFIKFFCYDAKYSIRIL